MTGTLSLFVEGERGILRLRCAPLRMRLPPFSLLTTHFPAKIIRGGPRHDMRGRRPPTQMAVGEVRP